MRDVIRSCPFLASLFFQQILVFGVETNIFVHEPAQRPDSQPFLSSIVQTSLDQLAAQASSLDRGRNPGMSEDDDLACQHIIEQSQISIDREFEAMLFWVVNYINAFGSHRYIFIPICDFANPSLS